MYPALLLLSMTHTECEEVKHVILLDRVPDHETGQGENPLTYLSHFTNSNNSQF